jgi:hypothetical protein
MQYVTKMASKPIDIQHDFVVIGAPEAPQSAYVGLFASALGLAQIFSDGRTGLLLSTLDRRPDVRAAGATDESVVTETGIRAAINAAVSGVTGYWKKVGTVLSPQTANDRIEVTVTGGDTGMYGVASDGIGVYGLSSTNYGVRGTSTSNAGVYGYSAQSFGVYGITAGAPGSSAIRGVATVDGVALSGQAVTGHAITGNSTSGNGGYFFSTNGIGVQATSVNSLALVAHATPADSSNLWTVLSLNRQTTGTAASGIGIGIDFQVEQASNVIQSQAYFAASLSNALSVSSDFSWRLRNANAPLAEVMRLTGAGVLNVKTGISVNSVAGLSGTSTIITGVSYNSGTMILTFTRATLTVNGGIVTAVEAASNIVIPLSP